MLIHSAAAFTAGGQWLLTGATDPLFCRRQTGGLPRAIDIAGGSRAQVRHVRCELLGDAFCEGALRWA